jgi:hypothetical protein
MSWYAARRANQREHPVLMCHERIRANQNSFDPTQNGRIGADPKRQTENCEKRKAGTAPKHSETETKILEKGLHLVRYSARSASMGLTNVARRAGKKHASNATTPSVTTVVARSAGLCGETS